MELNIIIFVVGSLAPLIDAFVYCYCGAMKTNWFMEYLDRLYDIRWYDLPVPLQKQLIIIIGNLQRPLEYQGLGMITLKLMTFVNVKLI